MLVCLLFLLGKEEKNGLLILWGFIPQAASEVPRRGQDLKDDMLIKKQTSFITGVPKSKSGLRTGTRSWPVGTQAAEGSSPELRLLTHPPPAPPPVPVPPLFPSLSVEKPVLVPKRLGDGSFTKSPGDLPSWLKFCFWDLSVLTSLLFPFSSSSF